MKLRPNRIRYGQDFQFRRGVPAGVEFEVSPGPCQGMYTLTAPGFGVIGDYGSGALKAAAGDETKGGRR